MNKIYNRKLKEMSINPTKEEKNLALSMEARVQVYLLYQLADLINLGMERGAFRGPEASAVGVLFDKLSGAVDSSFVKAREILESKNLEETLEEK